jgi:hypothetical protein
MATPPPGEARPTADEVEQLLAFRVTVRSLRYLATVFIAVGTVLGYFGYDAIKRVHDVERDLRTELSTARTELRSQAARVESLTTVLGIQLGAIEKRAASTEQALDRERTLLLAQTTSMTTNIGSQLGETRRFTAQLDSLMRAISGDRAALAARSELIGRSQQTMDSSLTTVRQSLADLRGRVYGSGLFVVKEKEQTQLADHGLVLSMTTIRGGLLRSFKIENMHTGQALWGPRDLVPGTPIKFSTDTLTYQAVPRWFLEYGGGKDAVGFEMRWERPVTPSDGR